MEKTEKRNEEKKNLNEAAAKKVAGFIIRVQSNWAAWMHNMDGKLSTRARKICFLIFIVLMAGSSVYSVVEVFSGGANPKTTVVTQEFPMPTLQHTDRIGADSSDAQLLEKLIAFERHMDSLSRSEKGQVEREQILRAHPGLMDSVRRVREMYTERLK